MQRDRLLLYAFVAAARHYDAL